MTLSRNLADYAVLREDSREPLQRRLGADPQRDETKIEDGLPTNWSEQVEPQFAPSGRIMTPEEIAAAAVYWLSDESRPISGSVVELEQYPIIGRNPTQTKGD